MNFQIHLKNARCLGRMPQTPIDNVSNAHVNKIVSECAKRLVSSRSNLLKVSLYQASKRNVSSFTSLRASSNPTLRSLHYYKFLGILMERHSFSARFIRNTLYITLSKTTHFKSTRLTQQKRRNSLIQLVGSVTSKTV